MNYLSFKNCFFLKNFFKNVENLAPDVIRRISKEIKDLSQEPMEGIKIIVNEQDITELHCCIDGPSKFSFKNVF